MACSKKYPNPNDFQSSPLKGACSSPFVCPTETPFHKSAEFPQLCSRGYGQVKFIVRRGRSGYLRAGRNFHNQQAGRRTATSFFQFRRPTADGQSEYLPALLLEECCPDPFPPGCLLAFAFSLPPLSCFELFFERMIASPF